MTKGDIGYRTRGSRGAATKISSRNLGGQRDFDPDNARLCRCGSTPTFEWRDLKNARGTGRFKCPDCGRFSAWEMTRDCATLAWNELGDQKVCGEARKIATD